MKSPDRKFMELAIEAARKCRGKPADPHVGAVAVLNGQVLGVAHRGEKQQGEHAEYTLLEGHLTERSLAKATIFTTLEPCTKRNSPKLACVDRIIHRKVSRVVIGMLDPNPLVSGLGSRRLREANITIDLFPRDLMSQLEELNRGFTESIKTDAVRRATQEIAELATRSGKPRQREAIGSTLRDCLASLRKINKGEIEIPGREAGYFKRFLERIDEAGEGEYFKAFIRLTAFEPDELINNSWFETFYAKLAAAVHAKKVVIEYVFLVRGKDLSEGERNFIDRYKQFARRIATVYPTDRRLPPGIIRPSIVLMQNQRAAFTHDRADDSSLLEATEWVTEQHYERLQNQYNRIEVMSRTYFSQDQSWEGRSNIESAQRQKDAASETPEATEGSIETVVTTIANERPDLAAHAAPDGTVTILFSDIVGSSRLNDQLGDAKWMDILHQHNEVFRHLVVRHKGYEVKTIGDAFMLAFQSGRDAVACAVNIQRAFAKRNATTRPLIRLRMGLHIGEVLREADDFFGRHVNVAARIASSASPNQILVSSLLRDVLNPLRQFRFVDRGLRKLKGFRAKQKVYSVIWKNQD
jgi:class 3 adenylate cyclase/pyrimidine deaminase RibD-like protein